MRSKKRAWSLALVMIAALALAACMGSGEPKLVLKGAGIVPSGMNNGVASAFLFIINDGGVDDVLTGCSIKEYPSANAMLHDMADGRMIMVHEIKIPANQTTALERGGKHLMFSGLPDKLEGDVTLVLNFRKSGSLEIRASLQY